MLFLKQIQFDFRPTAFGSDRESRIVVLAVSEKIPQSSLLFRFR